MQLPRDEERDEQVVRVPEALKMGAASLFDSKVHHGEQARGHHPASCTGTGDEVGLQEDNKPLGRRVGVWVCESETGEVDHVSGNVDACPEDDGPSGGLVERDVLVERNVVIQRRAADEGDEVTADWQQDEDDIDVQDERSTTSDRCR